MQTFEEVVNFVNKLQTNINFFASETEDDL